MKKYMYAAVCLGVLLLQASPVFAETAEEKGYRISALNDRSDRGFKDSEVDSKMVLHNAHGQKTDRAFRQFIFEVLDEKSGDKSIVTFDTPADVSGTSMLSHANILKADNQWLYLPALKRVKRISSVNKSGPFLGSEFAFEDFTAQELNKYKYKYLRSEPCPNVPHLMCDVVERFPQYKHSGYVRQIGWTDQQDYQMRQVDYYDRKNQLLKTLVFEDYKKYSGKFWRPHIMKMVNHVTGKSTNLSFGEYKFGVGMRDKDFVKGVLLRAR